MLFVNFLHLYKQSIHKIGANKVQDLRIKVMALKCTNVAFSDNLILLKLFHILGAPILNFVNFNYFWIRQYPYKSQLFHVMLYTRS